MMKERLHLSLFQVKEKQWGLAALLILMTVVSWHDLAFLLQYPVAVGLDGYYYVLQVDELLKHGRFYYPTTTPFVLYFLTGIRFLTGDTVLAVKVGSIVLHALLCLGIFALVTSATRSIWLGVLGIALASSSQLHFYMLAEFIKNLGAVTLLLWCGWVALQAARTRRTRLIYFSLLCLTAATISHRSALPLAAVTAASILLTRWLLMPTSRPRYRSASVATTILLWSAPAIAVRQPFIKLPTWATDEMLGRLQWPISDIASIEKCILLIVCPAILFLIIRFRERLPLDHRVTFFGSVALLSLLITVNPFLNYSFGWIGIAARLSSLAYIQLAILVPGLIWLVGAIHREAVFYGLALIIPLLVSLNGYAQMPVGLQPDFLSERVQLIESLLLYGPQIGPGSVVIAPHGDQFVVTSVLGIPSQQRWPQGNHDQTIYWLLRHVEDQALSSSMLILLQENNGRHTALVRDNDLQRQLEAMPSVERLRLFVTNPHLAKKYGTASGDNGNRLK